ncbi:uncharacterized protein Z518_04512 [Rhinocladiella mackenziei CBS 650.93]|uniref:Uncharacterized protein n=1 Tax=Rhinocladiella mackenziei CBS 650.93 TaxID=1442369 RepID=A0A0D2ITR1_9EURO|nr:uncharacterized protein Z518_04512 [Rhinocladiella mackenziei CBS 650.93]KIX06536.1 hypothetical protein Z518_04512 [Rhinocladiella mackenziei CBS 650.93]
MKHRNTNHTDGQVFLFVNKTQKSKSLSKSDGAIAKQINRHAQHFRSRKVEAQRITSARTSSSSARRIALDGWHRRETAQSSSNDESSPTSSPTENSTGVLGIPTPTTTHQSSSPPAIPTPQQSTNGHSSPHTPTSTIDVPQDGTNRHDGPIHHHDGQREQDDHVETLELTSPIYRANFSSYDCVDPFGSTPVRITSDIHRVLQYTLQIYSYAGNNYKLAFLPKHVRSTISQFPIGAVVQRSVYREHHLYSLMAAMTARLKHVFAVTPTLDDPQTIRASAEYFLKKELLRCSRSGTVDKQTILDILFLSVNLLQYELYDDVRKHLMIVAKLFHLLDLNEHLDKWISETAAHVDNQLALSTGKRPVLPRDFDPGPMLPERMATLRREAQRMKTYGYPNPTTLIVPRGPKASLGLTDVVSDLAATLDMRMGTRFTHGLDVGAFPGRLGQIVADLVDCIEIAKVVWLSPLAVCFDAEWLCRKARAVLRALLALAPEHNIGPLDFFSKCSECKRMCLMILMTHACTLIGFQTAKSNVRRLKEAMAVALKYWCASSGWTEDCIPIEPTRRLPMFTEVQAGFVLWSILTGLWSSEGLPEEEWFLVRALNVCQYFGYKTYDDLHNHMAQYLYSKTLQESAMRKTASRLEMLYAIPQGPHWTLSVA